MKTRVEEYRAWLIYDGSGGGDGPPSPRRPLIAREYLENFKYLQAQTLPPALYRRQRPGEARTADPLGQNPKKKPTPPAPPRVVRHALFFSSPQVFCISPMTKSWYSMIWPSVMLPRLPSHCPAKIALPGIPPPFPGL